MKSEILAMPAKSLKVMLPQLLPVYMPDGLRDRFFCSAEIWRRKSTAEWDEEWRRQLSPMRQLVDKLDGWQKLEDWELPLSMCEDTLLLFYVLRLQSRVIHVLHLPDEQFVPGEMDQFWHWLMDASDDDHWLSHTVFARDGLNLLAPQPWVWKIVLPLSLEQQLDR